MILDIIAECTFEKEVELGEVQEEVGLRRYFYKTDETNLEDAKNDFLWSFDSNNIVEGYSSDFFDGGCLDENIKSISIVEGSMVEHWARVDVSQYKYQN